MLAYFFFAKPYTSDLVQLATFKSHFVQFGVMRVVLAMLEVEPKTTCYVL